MDESPLPTAAPHRYRIPLVVMAAVTGCLAVADAALLIADDLSGEWIAFLLLLVVVLVAATVAVDRRAMTAEIKAHIDTRVREAAGRMDRRLDAITNGMVEHGIKLDDITEELPRFRQLHDHVAAVREHVRVVRSHVHTHAPGVYHSGPDKMTAIGTARPLDPDVIDMAARLQRKVDGPD